MKFIVSVTINSFPFSILDLLGIAVRYPKIIRPGDIFETYNYWRWVCDMQGSKAVAHYVHPKIAAPVAGKGNDTALYYRVYALSVLPDKWWTSRNLSRSPSIANISKSSSIKVSRYISARMNQVYVYEHPN